MSWSGFVKAINRGTTSMMQSMGMVEKTIDKDYMDEERRFKAFEQRIVRLQAESKQTLDSMRAISVSTKSLASVMDDFYDDGSNTPIAQAAKEFEKVATGLDEEIRTEYDQAYLKTVYEPITRFTATLPEIKQAMEKRDRKLLDYDAQRTKVKGLVEKPAQDPTKLPRNEQKLHEARQAYEALNNLILNEVPLLIDARVPVLDPSLEALLKSNLVFWRRGLQRLDTLQKRGLDQPGEGVVEQALEGMGVLSISRGDTSVAK